MICFQVLSCLIGKFHLSHKTTFIWHLLRNKNSIKVQSNTKRTILFKNEYRNTTMIYNNGNLCDLFVGSTKFWPCKFIFDPVGKNHKRHISYVRESYNLVKIIPRSQHYHQSSSHSFPHKILSGILFKSNFNLNSNASCVGFVFPVKLPNEKDEGSLEFTCSKYVGGNMFNVHALLDVFILNATCWPFPLRAVKRLGTVFFFLF